MTSSFTLNSLLSGGTSSYQEEVHIDRNGNVYIPSAARQQQYSPAPVQQQQQQQQYRQQQQPSRQAPAAPRAPVVTLALRVMRQLKKRCITASTVHSSMSKGKALIRLSAFKSGLGDFGVEASAREAAALFALLDRDGDGSLSWKELETLWSGATLTKLPVPGAAGSGDEFQTLQRQQQSPQQYAPPQPPPVAAAQIPLPSAGSGYGAAPAASNVRVNRHGSIDIRGSSAQQRQPASAQPFSGLQRIVSADAPLTPTTMRTPTAGEVFSQQLQEAVGGVDIGGAATGGGGGISSARRGTYFGTYSPQQAVTLRSGGRTNSTFGGGVDAAAATAAAAAALGAGGYGSSAGGEADNTNGSTRSSNVGAQRELVSLEGSTAQLLARLRAGGSMDAAAAPRAQAQWQQSGSSGVSLASSRSGTPPTVRDFAAHFARGTAERAARQAPQFDVMEMGSVAKTLEAKSNVRVNRHGSIDIRRPDGGVLAGFFGSPAAPSLYEQQRHAAEQQRAAGQASYAREQQELQRTAAAAADAAAAEAQETSQTARTRSGRRKVVKGSSARRGSFFGTSSVTNKARMETAANADTARSPTTAASEHAYTGEWVEGERPKGPAAHFMRRQTKKKKFFQGDGGWRPSPAAKGPSVKSSKSSKKAKKKKKTKKKKAAQSAKAKTTGSRKTRTPRGGVKKMTEEEQRAALVARARAEYFAERNAAKVPEAGAEDGEAETAAGDAPAATVRVNRHGSVDIRPNTSSSATKTNGGFGDFGKAAAAAAAKPTARPNGGFGNFSKPAASSAVSDSDDSGSDDSDDDLEDGPRGRRPNRRKMKGGSSQRRGSFFGTFKKSEVASQRRGSFIGGAWLFNEEGKTKAFVPPWKNTGGWTPRRSPHQDYMRDPNSSPTLEQPSWNSTQKYIWKDVPSMRSVEFTSPEETEELIGKPLARSLSPARSPSVGADGYAEGTRHHEGGTYDPDAGNLSSKERRKKFGGSSQRRGSFFGYKAAAKILPAAAAAAEMPVVKEKPTIKSLLPPKNIPKRMQQAAKVHVSRHGSISIVSNFEADPWKVKKSTSGAMSTSVGRNGERGSEVLAPPSMDASTADLVAKAQAEYARKSPTNWHKPDVKHAQSSIDDHMSVKTMRATKAHAHDYVHEREERREIDELQRYTAAPASRTYQSESHGHGSSPAASAVRVNRHGSVDIRGAQQQLLQQDSSSLMQLASLVQSETSSSSSSSTTAASIAASSNVADTLASILSTDLSSQQRAALSQMLGAMSATPAASASAAPMFSAAPSTSGAKSQVHVNRHGSVDIRGLTPPSRSAPTLVRIDNQFTSSSSSTSVASTSASRITTSPAAVPLPAVASPVARAQLTDAVAKIALACGALSPGTTFGLVATVANDSDTMVTPAALESALLEAFATAVDVDVSTVQNDSQYAPLIVGAATTSSLLFDAICTVQSDTNTAASVGLRPLLDAVALIAMIGFRVQSTIDADVRAHTEAVGSALFSVHASTVIDPISGSKRTVVLREAASGMASVMQTAGGSSALAQLISWINGGSTPSQLKDAMPRAAELDLDSFVVWFGKFVNAYFGVNSGSSPVAVAAAAALGAGGYGEDEEAY